VPLGSMVGVKFGWRAVFVGVGVLALIATLGLLAGLARDVGSKLHVTSLRERIGVIRQPGVLRTLLVTTLWATGAYTVYTYIATFLHATAGIEGAYLSAVLFVWGLSAAIGIFAGGTLTDRHGPEPVIVLGLALTALAFGGLSVSAAFLSKAVAGGPIMVAIVVWGLSGWAFFPAQQTRLIGVAGIRVAPIALSLNASFMFLGFSLGAAIGSATLTYAAPSALGWVGGLWLLLSLLLSVRTIRSTRALAEPALQQ
jgi:predicted MFS family arabinose efflux permease